jgi:anti-sigma factor (TIGR02949 family)
VNPCDELEPLRAALVDGEIGEADRARIEAHLAGCPACARHVHVERTIRELIRSRRAALTSDAAPARLHARVASLASGGGRRAMPSWAWPMAAAATVLLAVAGLRLATGWSTVVLAAQLTADHAKCHWLDGDRDTRDPRAVRAYLASHYGFDAPVPPSSSDGRLRLVGGRRCLTGEGRDVHILYRYDGQRVSLFLVPHDERRPQALDVLGAHTVMWPRPNGTYVLVADAAVPKATMPGLAAYMRRATDAPGNER